LNALIYLALAAFAAFWAKRLTSKIGIPIVTGYVLVGVVLGISVLKVFHLEILDSMTMVNDFALGVIGFTIGAELRKEVFAKLGRSIVLIALCEAFLTFVLVTGATFLMDPSRFYQALILGAVASATAPAATVYVIQQYKAKGPLTSTILAVVGIDDAFALVIFVFASVIVKGLLHAEHIAVMEVILTPVKEIGLSVILGVGMGFLFGWIFRKVRFPDDLLLGLAAFILAILGLAKTGHLSGLLAAMAFGTTVSNLNGALTHRSAKLLEGLSPLLFAYFFIFAGSHLDVGLLPQIGLLGLVFLIARSTGKISGASLGAWIGRAPDVVKRYVGLALIPQVGVAIALAIMVRQEFGTGGYGQAGEDLALLVINILLFTTVITEVVGPLLTKWALTKSGERQL